MENQINPSNEKLIASASELPSQQNQVVIDQDALNLYIEKLKLEQNLPLGFISGLAASLVGAVLWATITVVTNFQIGYMAIAVGFLVGYAIRYYGKGIDQIFGILGAVLSLAGCLLGNFLTMVVFAANAEGLGYFELLLNIDYNVVPAIMMESFSPMDLLFYGFAIYEGYKFSFREITQQEITANAAK